MAPPVWMLMKTPLPSAKAVRRRAIWLGINRSPVAAAAVISAFEETIIKVVALAVLMPVVASMGGIAGTQTLTLVIRGQALGQLNRLNMLDAGREFSSQHSMVCCGQLW